MALIGMLSSIQLDIQSNTNTRRDLLEKDLYIFLGALIRMGMTAVNNRV